MKSWLPLSLSFLAVTGVAAAQDLDSRVGALACVMEPKAVIKLGSAEEGILEEFLVERGDLIQQGQVVARLNSDLEEVNVEVARVRAQSDVEVESSRARLEYRESEAARIEQLHAKKIVATKSMDEAAVERRLAVFALRAAELQRKTARLEYRHAKARLDRRSINSPVEGVVIERNMAVGEYAHEQVPIMTVAQIDPLNVEVFVPIGLYGSIAVGMPAEVEPEAPIGGVHRARVTVVDRVFDTASGTFGVRLALPNPEGRLPAGLKCKVRFLPMEVAAETPLSGDAYRSSGAEALEATEAAAVPEAEPEPQRDALIFEIQRRLARAGYDTGSPDGRLGPRTRKAIESYQRDQGLSVDGRPSAALRLRLEAPPKVEPPKAKAAEAPAPEPQGPEIQAAATQAPAQEAAAATAGQGTGWYDSFRQASKALREGDETRAAELYEEALDSRNLPVKYQVLALTRRSYLHDRAGRADAALADLQQALEIKPENPQALAQRGNLFLKQRRFGLAVEDYGRALDLEPTLVEAYYGRAIAQGQLGDFARAIEDYDRISNLDPAFSAAYFNRAVAYERLGDLERAARDYAALYALEPDYPGLEARMQQLGLLQQ